MLPEANTSVPLYDFPSWLPGPTPLFALDEKIGSRTRVREPDRILIIEDDLLIATQIETALSQAGFEIIGVATTRDEAIEITDKVPPDLVITDIKLAGNHDGVDTALELFRSHGIRCIFATAYSDLEARRRAQPAAPLGWLQKPYSMGSLTAMVRQAVNNLRDERDS